MTLTTNFHSFKTGKGQKMEHSDANIFSWGFFNHFGDKKVFFGDIFCCFYVRMLKSWSNVDDEDVVAVRPEKEESEKSF